MTTALMITVSLALLVGLLWVARARLSAPGGTPEEVVGALVEAYSRFENSLADHATKSATASSHRLAAAAPLDSGRRERGKPPGNDDAIAPQALSSRSAS